MLKIRQVPQDCWLKRRRELVWQLQRNGWVDDSSVARTLEIVPWHIFFADYASAKQVYSGERIRAFHYSPERNSHC